MNVVGAFETHFTVKTAAWERAFEWAAAHGMKVTHIVLAHGEHASQPMLTRHSTGSLEGTLRESRCISEQMAAKGLAVCRMKIEVGAGNAAAPADPHEAEGRPDDWYFEQHIKLLLPPSQDHSLIMQLAERHGARLSRNALRTREDGFEERFLTQRLHHGGRAQAESALSSLLDALLQHSIVVLETESEYVVFDSNLALDSGWLDHP